MDRFQNHIPTWVGRNLNRLLSAQAVMAANSIANRKRRRQRKPFACRLMRRENITVNQRPKSRRKDKFAGRELQWLSE
jgi:hypothetical protein